MNQKGLLAVLFVVLAACPSSGGGDDGPDGSDPSGAPTPELKDGGHVSVGVLGSPATLDPYSPVASDLTRALVRPLYPSLYRLMPDGSAEPYLASSLEESGSGAVVELADARWSNGGRITAADVVASVRRATEPSGFAGLSATAAGAHTVEFEGRVSDWPRTLARAAFVLPSGTAGRVSGGPLKISRYVEGLKVAYARNKGWWAGEPAHLERVEVFFVQQIDTMLQLLDEERLDAAAIPWAVNLDQRLNERGIQHAEMLGWESVELDLDPSDLDRDRRVAIAAAIDRRDLAAGFVRGGGRVSNTLHPGPGAGGAAGPFGDLPNPGDGSETVVLAVPAGDELMTLTQRVIQVQLIERGYDADIASIEPFLLYGEWEDELPVDMTLRRRFGAAGWPEQEGARGDFDRFPLFQVKTLVAWSDAIVGPSPNPSIEGPLWNVDTWGLLR